MVKVLVFSILLQLSLQAFGQASAPMNAALETTSNAMQTVETINTLPRPVVECPLVPSESDVSRLRQTSAAPLACVRAVASSDGTPVVQRTRNFEPLAENQHRLMVKDSNRYYQTGHYLLKRLSGENYQAVLNLNFSSDVPGLAEAMMNRTRKCMQDLSQFIRPANGKRIEILIMTPKEVTDNLPENARPYPVSITVTPEEKDYRGDAQRFGSNFTCKTIGHELIHHLGLVDEYKENGADERSDNWSCRALTTGTSYMRNTTDSFLDVVPQSFNCHCDTSCQDTMRLSDAIKTSYLSQRPMEYFTSEEPLKKACEKVGSPTQVFLDERPVSNNLVFKSRSGSVYTFEGMHTTGVGLVMVSAHELRKRPEAQLSTIQCDCSDDPSGNCDRAARDVIQRSARNNPRTYCPNPMEDPRDLQISTSNSPSRVVGDRIYIQTRPIQGSSLLTSGQVDQIISGNCLGGSPQYQRCAALANIPASSPACVMPTECRSTNYYLNNGAATSDP